MAKGLAALIVGAMKPKKALDKSDDAAPESSDDDMDEAKKAAAEELLAAIKSEDAEALASALSDFMEACDY